MKNFIFILFLTISLSFTNKTCAQEKPMIGEIKMFSGNYAPRGYALCNGQLLQISANETLFSILGTFYGGDGRTTFALPDLRGRAPMHSGSGKGLARRVIGELGGSERVILTVDQMPTHSHIINAVADTANQGNANGNLPASTTTETKTYSSLSSNATMDKSMISNTGSSRPIANMQPFIVINYIIALEGSFPSRN